MKFTDYKYLVLSDLYRETGSVTCKALLKEITSGECFKYVFWMRTCRYLSQARVLKYPLFFIARAILNHYRYKLCIDVPYDTQIGPGFYIGHFGAIIVNKRSVIGKNCNISQDVTLGQANRGKNKGYPVVGDNVYIGPGAKLVGAVHIGNNASIGANCVVTKDVPDNAVAVGIPANIISFSGSEGYVNLTDYEERIR